MDESMDKEFKLPQQLPDRNPSVEELQYELINWRRYAPKVFECNVAKLHLDDLQKLDAVKFTNPQAEETLNAIERFKIPHLSDVEAMGEQVKQLEKKVAQQRLMKEILRQKRECKISQYVDRL